MWNYTMDLLVNKLKGYGTNLDGWEKWGDIWVISPKVKNIFDLYVIKGF